MNILILNWRDIKSPRGGGAEILTHEMAKRWAKAGHQVTQFSSFFEGAQKEETIDRVKIIRQGHSDLRYPFSSVHFRAFKYYQKNKNMIDVIVDEAHGFPFFTSLYVHKRKVVLICEVAEELWVKMFGPIFGPIGKFVERIYLRFLYKNTPYLTISNSTKGELIKKGVKPQNITVLPMGLTIPKTIKNVDKEKIPTLIFVGRLTKSKGIEDAIMAIEKISKEKPNVKLWIVGSGEKEYVSHLQEVAAKLNLINNIIFWGFVSDEKKFELMAKAHILLAPSVKEGWGLIVPEAAYIGTPSIVYNVFGLRDIVDNGVNGIIVKANTPLELAKEVIDILADNNLYEKLRINAKKSALNYNWDNTAKVALEIISGKLI